MNRLIIILILVTSLCLTHCQNNEVPIGFEREVFDQIFVSVVDSTYKDRIYSTGLSDRQTDIFDAGATPIGTDTLEKNEKVRLYEREIKELRKNAVEVVLAVNDTVSRMWDEDRQLIQTHFKSFNSGDSIQQNDDRYKIDLSRYKNRKFVFRYLSELPEDTEFGNWSVKYKKFAGAMFFSRILFDRMRENGALSVSFYCGSKCGLGYIVFIKKVKEKWVVDKVIDTWIS